MKYKVESITVVSNEIKDVRLPGPGDLKKPYAVYESVEIPDQAVGIHISEEILVAMSQTERAQLTGMPRLDETFIRKHTRGILRITYLMPEQIKIGLPSASDLQVRASEKSK